MKLVSAFAVPPNYKSRSHQGMDISVVIPTYNRAHLLDEAMRPLLNQKVDGIQYEIIIVDNNSADQTEEKVSSYVKQDSRIRYLSEERQGVAHARNAGIGAAEADLIAFCDDDVRVAEDWLQRMYEALRRFPDADFVGGRVLPVWKASPPAWVNERMAPLASQNYGDRPLMFSLKDPRCLISACLGVRRSAFARAGQFPLETQRVKDTIGSTEDRDWETRVWETGGHGMYVPDVVCYCDIPASRLAKSYHRRWHLGHGKFNALARHAEYEGGSWRFLDVPSFVYRQLLEAPVKMAQCVLRRDSAAAFEHEADLLFSAGFIKQRWTGQLSRGPDER